MRLDGRVGVDADEVLWGCLAAFLEYYNRVNGTNYTVEDFYTYDWWTVLGITRQEAIDAYAAFHAAGEGYHMVPDPDAYAALCRIREAFEKPPVVITSRLASLEEETQHLVGQHFPNVFEDIHFGSHFGGAKRTKGEMCLETGVTVLIEDQLAHALNAAAAGVTVLLFGAYGWNTPTEPLPYNVIPVATWADVLRELGIN